MTIKDKLIWAMYGIIFTWAIEIFTGWTWISYLISVYE
jgi:hypothetical protein|tara:strand:- start:173 stop:286 length:114 start_codon:yes stop_codon:yes gene_type:complete